ncbi:MAG: hypothetical protein IMY76_07475 [Chloroflexi bacterium]|nr:hypothetical protein [Chloroflexota bacterium]
MTENPITPEITSEDKLWAALAYVFSPIVPIILMLIEDKKDRPYIKEHNVQALVVGVLNAILAVPLSATIVLGCVPLLIWLVMLYWGFQAYQGNSIEIPLVTKFVKDQGWA